MKEHDMLCALVIFPGVENYLKDCLTSISNQEYQNFDLLILEDELTINGFSEYISRNYLVENAPSSNPVKNREFIIKYALTHSYEKLVFFDGDDYSEPDRLVYINDYLNYYPLVCHNMRIIDKNGKVVKDRFVNKSTYKSVFCWKDLLYKNFSGLGNSGYNVKMLKNYIEVDTSIIAFDWWLAHLLLKNRKGLFINKVLSSYRQYEENTVSLFEENEEEIKKEFNIKTVLYTEMIKKLNYSLTKKKEIAKAFIYTIDKYLEYQKIHKIEKIDNLWWNNLC